MDGFNAVVMLNYIHSRQSAVKSHKKEFVGFRQRLLSPA